MIKNSGISIAKNVFQVCLAKSSGKVVFNKKVSCKKLVESVLQLDSKRVVMEAC